jgi:hypothetical protein
MLQNVTTQNIGAAVTAARRVINNINGVSLVMRR